MMKADDIVMILTERGEKYWDELVKKKDFNMAWEILKTIGEENISVDPKHVLDIKEVWEDFKVGYEVVYGVAWEDEWYDDGGRIFESLVRDEMIAFMPIFWD